MYKKKLNDNYARFTVGGEVKLNYDPVKGTKKVLPAEIVSKTGKALEVKYSYRGEVSTIWLPRLSLQKIVDGNLFWLRAYSRK